MTFGKVKRVTREWAQKFAKIQYGVKPDIFKITSRVIWERSFVRDGHFDRRRRCRFEVRKFLVQSVLIWVRSIWSRGTQC